MPDIASLVLAVDASQVKTGTAALDGLAASGARAEAATVGLSGGFKGAGAEASAMAAAAQLSARAAVDQAAGFGAATNAARVNTMAMRESLVVAREISRGNFTRLPGSLTLLAQGIGSQGGIGAFASAMAAQLGLIRKVQDAELAEAATAAASAAAGVEAAARKAGANILAADTEVALAEAQMRVAEGATAEAAAQARVAAANEAVTAAAAEAAIAENALATAQGRAAETGAASAAATRTLIGGSGIGLLGIATVSGVAYIAFKKMQDEIRDNGALDKYAESSRLSAEQIKKLGGEVDYTGHNIRTVTGLSVTFGDVMVGVFDEIRKEANNGGAWDNFKKNSSDAFSGVLSVWNQTSAALSAGLWTLGDIAKDVFQYIAQQIGQGFYDGVNKAVDALNSLNQKIPKWAGGGDPNLIPHLGPDKRVADLPGLGATIRKQADKNFADALAANNAAYAGVETGAEAHRLATLQKLNDAHNPPKPKKAPGDHGLQEALDKLDAEIKGQYALAAAYQVSDAAAQRAIAHQKAAVDAIQHKGQADQFYAKELQKAVAEDVAKQAKSNADLQVQTSIRARLNGELADGTITVSQYNDQLKLQTTLQKLNVDLENADATHKQTVRDIIKQTIDLEGEQLQLESQLNALKQIASNDNDIARLRLENSLMGASNKERAVALAQLEAMQSLQQIDPNGLLTNRERNNYVQSAINKAAAGVQTPFQQWARDIPQTSAAITEALQGIETKGFDSLAQGIAGVITGTESLGKAFRNISTQIIGDIIQMTVKMLLFRAISSVFGSIGGGGGFGGVTSLPTSFSGIPHWASGGSMIIGGNGGVDNNVLSLNGNALANVGQGETLSVTPNRPAANNNGRQQLELTIITAPSDEAWAKVSNISAQQIGSAAPIIIKQAATSTIKAITRPKISGGR